MKIGPYEIRRYDKLNLQLIKHVEREIKGQGVADMMNKALDPDQDLWIVGDKYMGEEEIGFYPKLEMALTRILDDELLDSADAEILSYTISIINRAKEEIIKAVNEIRD